MLILVAFSDTRGLRWRYPHFVVTTRVWYFVCQPRIPRSMVIQHGGILSCRSFWMRSRYSNEMNAFCWCCQPFIKKWRINSRAAADVLSSLEQRKLLPQLVIGSFLCKSDSRQRRDPTSLVLTVCVKVMLALLSSAGRWVYNVRHLQACCEQLSSYCASLSLFT